MNLSCKTIEPCRVAGGVQEGNHTGGVMSQRR